MKNADIKSSIYTACTATFGISTGRTKPLEVHKRLADILFDVSLENDCLIVINYIN